MKSFLLLFILLLLVWSCKKKHDDPQPEKLDELVYQTTFDDMTWSTRTGKHYTSAYNSSQLALSVDTINWYGIEISPSQELTYNYSVQVDVTILLDDPNKVGYGGFVYNYIDANNYCIFYVGTNGIFYAYKIEGGEYHILVYNTFSKDLLKGSSQKNKIELRQYDNSQVVILNGVTQASLPSQRPAGYLRVGLAVSSSSNYYTPTTALFDNFTIKKIY